MLKRLVVLAMLSTVGFAQEASKPVGAAHHAESKAKKLTNAEFDAYLAHPDQILLIDVRRPDEVSTIGGFPVYLSIQLKDLKNHLSEIPKDREIITVSNHSGRAGFAADLLESNGFNVLGAVGADTYQKGGGTLAVKIPVPAPRPATGTEGAANKAPAGEGSNN